MKIKLLYKFILIISAAAVIPLAVTGFHMTEISRSALEESILNNHITAAAFLAGKIDDFIGSLGEKLQFVISSQSVRNLDYRGKQALIQSFLSSSDHFITVSIANSAGEEFIKTYHPDYASEASIEDHGGTDLFARAGAGPAVSGVYRVGGEPRMDIIYPAGDEYLFITLTLSRLWDDIKGADVGRESFAFLVDPEGIVLAHPNPSLEGEELRIPPVEAVLSRASIGSMEYGYKGERSVGAYAPVSGMGWGVVTSQPYRFAYASAIRMKQNAYRWILAAFVVCVIFSGLLARSLSTPIMELIRGAESVAAGNFNGQVKIRTRDELQALAGTFNNMVGSLKKYDEMQIDRIMDERTKTKAVIFSISDGIVLTDYSGAIMLVNDRAKELLEFSGEPAEGEHIFKYVKSDSLKRAFSEIKEAEVDLSAGVERKIVKAFTSEVETASGKKLGKMRVIRDITLEKEIEEVKERFLHSVTHDLKNPLSAIIGLADLLKISRKDDMSDDEKKYFEVLKTEADRLMGMINDILNLARLEAGKLEVEMKKFDLAGMLSSIGGTFGARALNEGITLETGSPGPVYVSADEKLLRRVVINLLGNSLKYTPRGGKVTLSALKKDGYALVSVIDTGEGMPAEMCGKIFDRFQQIQGQSRGGTGIGLNVSKEIVEAHGGRIWAESEPGRGSAFRFTLPEADA